MNVLLYIALGLFLYLIVKNLWWIINNHLNYKKLYKDVQELEKSNEKREWVSIPFMGRDFLVCKKTGFCPETKAFFSKNYIKQIEEYQKEKEEFLSFKEDEIKRIAKTYNLTQQDLNSIQLQLDNILVNFLNKKKEERSNV